MTGKGFEVVVKNDEGKVVIDRSVNNMSDGTGWCENYVSGNFAYKEATFFIDGKPVETHYRH